MGYFFGRPAMSSIHLVMICDRCKTCCLLYVSVGYYCSLCGIFSDRGSIVTMIKRDPISKIWWHINPTLYACQVRLMHLGKHKSMTGKVCMRHVLIEFVKVKSHLGTKLYGWKSWDCLFVKPHLSLRHTHIPGSTHEMLQWDAVVWYCNNWPVPFSTIVWWYWKHYVWIAPVCKAIFVFGQNMVTEGHWLICIGTYWKVPKLYAAHMYPPPNALLSTSMHLLSIDKSYHMTIIQSIYEPDAASLGKHAWKRRKVNDVLH